LPSLRHQTCVDFRVPACTREDNRPGLTSHDASCVHQRAPASTGGIVLGDRRSRVQIPPARPPFRWSAFPSAMLAASSSPQLVRPCLDCGNPTHEGTRCPQCRRARDREKYERGRSTDLPGWRKISRRVREQWIDQRGLVCPSFERPAHSVPHISKITVHKIDPWNPHGPLRRLLLRVSQPRRRRATKNPRRHAAQRESLEWNPAECPASTPKPITLSKTL
jgi:hypothetical protein